MSFHNYNEDFQVEELENGIIDEVGDRIYSYKIVSNLPLIEVRDFCMKKLQVSYYKKQKPNPFSPELIKFKYVSKVSDEIGNLYTYMVKKPSTF